MAKINQFTEQISEKNTVNSSVEGVTTATKEETFDSLTNTIDLASKIFLKINKIRSKDYLPQPACYAPFLNLLKSDPELCKELSKFLADWYTHNSREIYGITEGQDPELCSKIRSGNSELSTEEFWNEKFFPRYKNILDDR